MTKAFKCAKCEDTGYHRYDANHSKPCDACCPHDRGWYELKQDFGDNNGKYACMRGCGYIITPEQKVIYDVRGCIQTYTGVMFDPLKPDINKIYLLDIAHALALTCRYAGHCLRPYSVAEHGVHVARVVRKRGGDVWQQLDAILHDTPEAYLQDLVSPVKRRLRGYADFEDVLTTVIYHKYFVRPYAGMADLVQEVDYGILSDEAAQNMSPPERPWTDLGKTQGVKLRYWGPTRAKFEFLSELVRLLVVTGVAPNYVNLSTAFARPGHKLRMVDRMIVSYLQWRSRFWSSLH